MLELRDVDVFYGEVQALRGVSLTVEAGRIVTLIGANGAGKSTTLRTISGLLRPNRGTIRFDGMEVGGTEPHEITQAGLIHVPEGRMLLESMTVRENLLAGAYCRRDKDGIQSDLEAVEARFGALQDALRPVASQAQESSPEPPADPAAAPEEEPDPSEQLDALRRLAEEHRGSYELQFALGRALHEAGDAEGAVAALERAAALAPMATGMDSPRGLLAEIAQAQGDRERALRELELLLQHDETSLEAARQLAALAEEADDERLMTVAYDRVVGIDPFDPVPHVALGRMALARGDADTAALEFTVALAAGPVDRVSAWSDLAESHLLGGRLDEARRAALAALEMAPTYERAQELLLRVVEEGP